MISGTVIEAPSCPNCKSDLVFEVDQSESSAVESFDGRGIGSARRACVAELIQDPSQKSHIAK